MILRMTLGMALGMAWGWCLIPFGSRLPRCCMLHTILGISPLPLLYLARAKSVCLYVLEKGEAFWAYCWGAACHSAFIYHIPIIGAHNIMKISYFTTHRLFVLGGTMVLYPLSFSLRGFK